MKKIIGFTSIAVLCALTASVQANGFSYTYIEGGLVNYDNDEIEDGKMINASVALTDSVHLIAGGLRTKLDDWDSSFEQYKLGLGTHTSVSEVTDVVLEASAIHVIPPDLHSPETGYDLSARIRTKLNNHLEGNVGMNYTKLPDLDISETNFDVGGRLYFNQNISAGVNYLIDSGGNDDDSNLWTSSLRMDFL